MSQTNYQRHHISKLTKDNMKSKCNTQQQPPPPPPSPEVKEQQRVLTRQPSKDNFLFKPGRKAEWDEATVKILLNCMIEKNFYNQYNKLDKSGKNNLWKALHKDFITKPEVIRYAESRVGEVFGNKYKNVKYVREKFSSLKREFRKVTTGILRDAGNGPPPSSRHPHFYALNKITKYDSTFWRPTSSSSNHENKSDRNLIDDNDDGYSSSECECRVYTNSPLTPPHQPPPHQPYHQPPPPPQQQQQQQPQQQPQQQSQPQQQQHYHHHSQHYYSQAATSVESETRSRSFTPEAIPETLVEKELLRVIVTELRILNRNYLESVIAASEHRRLDRESRERVAQLDRESRERVAARKIKEHDKASYKMLLKILKKLDPEEAYPSTYDDDETETDND
ncbi:hypothetical protein BD770DRAFT_193 [Pilaira anomala]|nr:hypothetical protein BD770DRAFT_193 [Pilaira anomala]